MSRKEEVAKAIYDIQLQGADLLSKIERCRMWAPLGRRSRPTLVLCLLVACLPIESETALVNVLSEVQQIRERPAERSVRDIPVNIRAVGSLYDQPEKLLFLQNDEAGILVGTIPLLVWSLGVLGIFVCFASGWILSSRRRVRAPKRPTTGP